MNAAAAPATPDVGFVSRSASAFKESTGQSILVWLGIAVANVAFQILLFRNLFYQSPGEFGLLTTAFGIVGLLTVPLLALLSASLLYPSSPQANGPNHRLDAIRASAVTAIETAAWIWAAVCVLLIFLPSPLPSLARFPLQILALMNVLIGLGAIVGRSVCENDNPKVWATLLIAAALVRVVLGGWLTSIEPWAEAGLTVSLLAGFITLAPALRSHEIAFHERVKACRTLLDHEFLLYAGATLSVLLGLYLFTNADRILAITWPGIGLASAPVIGPTVKPVEFDQYQAAGLLARSVLWGTQPFLWIHFAQRARLKKTTPFSLTFFWIYLAALALGALAFGGLTQSHPGSSAPTGGFGPTFAAAVIPLGFLQGIGFFSLASRRYHECFVLGGCGVAYTVVLYLFGRKPELMLPYMFGSGVVSLMIVLFVGIARWGRKQP
jgi:hypothetical protein